MDCQLLVGRLPRVQKKTAVWLPIRVLPSFLIEQAESMCSLASFSNSFLKSRDVALVNFSDSSTRGQRSLLKWLITCFLCSVGMLECAFPMNRSVWVAASAPVYAVSHSACHISRMLVSDPMESSSRVWR